MAAAEAPVWLADAQAARQAAASWSQAPVLGLDTEFVRETTYHANLGLVQVSDGTTAWLLDPLVEDTLPVLRELLQDPACIKLFHSPSEDLETLRQTVGALPQPLVDTQLACAMLGQPLQLGYHGAVEWLLGMPVAKELTRSDWCARPLRTELLHYAALDVCLLPMMWELLRERLVAAGRLAWLEEDCARQLRAAASPGDPEDAWLRIRARGRLDPVGLALLQVLAAWREREARLRNRPRGFIVSDAVLVDIARLRITSVAGLSNLAELHARTRERHAASLIKLVEETLAAGRTIQPEAQASRAQKRQLDALRERLAARAGELGVEPSLLASRRELEQLVMRSADERLPENLPERLRGWRYEMITRELLALC